MCFTLTSLTWASKGLREVDCQGTACTQKEQDYLCLTAPSYCLCILHVYIQHMCMCVHVSLTAWHTHIYTDTHTHTHTSYLSLPSVCVHLGCFETPSCHIQSARCSARPCLRPHSSKTSAWLDLGHVFWYTNMAHPVLNSLGSQLWQTRVLSAYFNVRGFFF